MGMNQRASFAVINIWGNKAMQDEQSQGQKLPAVLGAWTALAAIVGSVIGSGIFLVPAKVANGVPFVGGIVAVWLIGGLFSAAGALTLAELGAMMPRAPWRHLRLHSRHISVS